MVNYLSFSSQAYALSSTFRFIQTTNFFLQWSRAPNIRVVRLQIRKIIWLKRVWWNLLEFVQLIHFSDVILIMLSVLLIMPSAGTPLDGRLPALDPDLELGLSFVFFKSSNSFFKRLLLSACWQRESNISILSLSSLCMVLSASSSLLRKSSLFSGPDGRAGNLYSSSSTLMSLKLPAFELVVIERDAISVSQSPKKGVKYQLNSDNCITKI